MTTGRYDRESGIKVAEETGQLVGYGQLFIANVSPIFQFTDIAGNHLSVVHVSESL